METERADPKPDEETAIVGMSGGEETATDITRQIQQVARRMGGIHPAALVAPIGLVPGQRGIFWP